MNIFNSVKQTRVKKSLFDLTHDVKLSCNMGELVPILNMDCVPGDKIQISGETLVRFAPMLAPLMHRVDITIHYFFCPWRILWPNFEKFISGAALNPSDPITVPVPPLMDIVAENADAETVRLLDYLGLPPYAGQGTEPTFLTTLWSVAAYQRIWYEYYRDQNQQLVNDVNQPWMLGDGMNTPIGDNGHLHNRAWEHDYFTAALPWAQKGGNVHIPMQNAPGQVGTFISQSDGTPVGAGALSTDAASQLVQGATPLVVNAGTINDLRKAYKLQEWLEKNARGGTRLRETILSHYGVNTSDKRLQRPEYITGLKTPVVVSEVLNTTGTTTLPQGNMAGHGVAVTSGQAGTYFCEEWGTLMGIMSILPKTAYMQGVPKSWLKVDYLDFGWPEFAHLGEQAIDLNEIYAYVQAPSEEAWGYVPRYSEYKFMFNRVAGDFRTTLNYWHMARIFAAAPGLSEDFIVSDPTTRIFAVTDPDVQHMYVQVLNHIKALRPFPKYGTPGW